MKNQSTPYQFLNVFQQLAFNFLGNQPAKSSWVLNTSENFLTLIVKNENSIFTPASEVAMAAINQTLFQLSCNFPMENNTTNNGIICNLVSQIQKLNNYCQKQDDGYRREINSIKNKNNNYFQAAYNF